MKDIGTLVYTAKDTYEAGLICSALGDADIPSYTKELGAGQVFKVYTGFSNCGVEVYVPEESAGQAKIIIDALNAESGPEEGPEEGETGLQHPQDAGQEQ